MNVKELPKIFFAFTKMNLSLKDVLSRVLLTSFIYRRLKAQEHWKFLGLYCVVHASISSGIATRVSNLFSVKFGETLINRIASILLLLKPIRAEYSKLMTARVSTSREKLKEQWKRFGPVITSIPEEGYSEERIQNMVLHFSATIEQGLIGDYHSGSIYSYSFVNSKYDTIPPSIEDDNREENKLETSEDFGRLSASLSKLFTFSFEHSYLWNSLHDSEFGIGYWLIYQVVRMVGEIYGGNKDEVNGFVTSGGTDSLMNAVRLYKNWGSENKNLDVGQHTIIACETVHAALNKGCIANDVKLILIPSDENGRMSIKHLEEAAKLHEDSLVAIVASTPSYTLGVIDDIKAVAAVAQKYKVGMHVDSCLGGFILNYLDIDNKYLAIPGVTSLSCDTHKNGWSPKGSSVLLTRPIYSTIHSSGVNGTVNLSFYSIYSIPSWDGGVYGTPGNPGSQHVVHVLHAYIALLRIGKRGYRAISKNVNDCVVKCMEVLKAEPRIELLGNVDGRNTVNVFAFRIKKSLNWGVGATYSLAHELKKRKIICSALSGDRLHYCVTNRSSADPGFSPLFAKRLREALDAVEEMARSVAKGEAAFSGEAGVYGTLEAALKPSVSNTKSLGEYATNILLGERVATDLVKSHFFAFQDPFSQGGL